MIKICAVAGTQRWVNNTLNYLYFVDDSRMVARKKQVLLRTENVRDNRINRPTNETVLSCSVWS